MIEHQEKSYRFKQSILEWISVLVVYFLFLGYTATSYGIVLLYTIALTMITMAASKIFQKVIVPKYLDQGYKLNFVVYTVSLFLGMVVLTLSLLIISVGYLPDVDVSGIPQTSQNYTLLLALMFLIILTMGFLSQWKKNQLHRLESQTVKNQMLQREVEFKREELQYLKGQLQPHFLFNTLNTIYGEALKKSDETPQLVLKLSELLNYTLYQTNKELVDLVNEIDQIRQYLELERIRFTDSLSITLEEDLDDDTLQLPPLLLLPLIENAFKHGVKENGKLMVAIKITLKAGDLYIEVENSAANDEIGKGIGLSNMRKRLESLYPNRHELTINQKESTFVVQLQISSAHLISQ